MSRGGEACCRVARSAGAVHCRSLVRPAGGGAGRSPEALARLVEHAWPEVHDLVRRQGVRGPDADDLTQAYFAVFIEKGYARRLESWNGCVRPFLHTSLRHFLSNARDHARAQKRGGRAFTVSLDEALARGQTCVEPVDAATPESLLAAAERQCALRRALAAVRSESSRSRRLDVLLSHLERGDVDCAAIARGLGISSGAARVAVHRLRRRLAHAMAAFALLLAVSSPAASGEVRAPVPGDRVRVTWASKTVAGRLEALDDRLWSAPQAARTAAAGGTPSTISASRTGPLP